jgi:hypothetical protein
VRQSIRTLILPPPTAPRIPTPPRYGWHNSSFSTSATVSPRNRATLTRPPYHFLYLHNSTPSPTSSPSDPPARQRTRPARSPRLSPSATSSPYQDPVSPSYRPFPPYMVACSMNTPPPELSDQAVEDIRRGLADIAPSTPRPGPLAPSPPYSSHPNAVHCSCPHADEAPLAVLLRTIDFAAWVSGNFLTLD